MPLVPDSPEPLEVGFRKLDSVLPIIYRLGDSIGLVSQEDLSHTVVYPICIRCKNVDEMIAIVNLGLCSDDKIFALVGGQTGRVTDTVCQAGNGSPNLCALQPEAPKRMSKSLRSISQRVAVACLPLTDPFLVDQHFE